MLFLELFLCLMLTVQLWEILEQACMEKILTDSSKNNSSFLFLKYKCVKIILQKSLKYIRTKLCCFWIFMDILPGEMPSVMVLVYWIRTHLMMSESQQKLLHQRLRYSDILHAALESIKIKRLLLGRALVNLLLWHIPFNRLTGRSTQNLKEK